MPFHNPSLCAGLWCARMLASFSAGQRHWMWLCVSAGVTCGFQPQGRQFIPCPLPLRTLFLRLQEAQKAINCLFHTYVELFEASKMPYTICVLDCGVPICRRLSAQVRDIGCGSVSLLEPHIEHMQRKLPYPTCGEGHCRGTLQRSTGASASLLSLFPSCSEPGPACFGPDQVGAARMP